MAALKTMAASGCTRRRRWAVLSAVWERVSRLRLRMAGSSTSLMPRYLSGRGVPGSGLRQ
ncbi:C5 cytosine methyltransferase DmtA [Actinomyces denticolens]|nr:C5 cytosine methyltransferase DmtA [Actinomyces denticolens]